MKIKKIKQAIGIVGNVVDSLDATGENDVPNVKAVNSQLNKVIKINDSDLLMSSDNFIEIVPLVGSNYAPYGNSYYYKVGTKVHVHLGLSNLTANDSNVIYNLPDGFKPWTTMSAVGTGSGLDDIVAAQISKGGEIRVYPSKSYALFDFEFDVFKEQ